MQPDSKTRILSSWCATKLDIAKTIFPALVAARKNLKNEDNMWQTVLTALDAPQLKRILTIVRSRQPDSLTQEWWNRLSLDDTHAFWDGQPIGIRRTYFKTVLPYEAQTRVAYDVFFDQFVTFAGKQYKAIMLQQNDLSVELFIPNIKFDLNAIWSGFIADVFSANAMQRYFVPLLNTIKMTDKGFSALDVPIITDAQARFLAAFYLTNLQSLQKGDAKRQREITEEQQKLTDESSPKEKDRILKKIEKMESELQIRSNRYEPLYQKVETLRAQYPNWINQVEMLAKTAFTPTAGTQLSKVENKIGKCINQIEELISPNFYEIPPLFSNSPIVNKIRTGGDSNTQICYGCGQELNKKEKQYKANKFIFENPSQRLQSGGGEKQPPICPVCAAISFISPVKLGGGRLIVRMYEKSTGEKQYLADDQLRMLTIGEMNLLAGKHVVIKADEKIAGKLVSDKLGGLQYALYKVGVSFEPEVFEKFNLESLFETEVLLKSHHLAWMHYLEQVFAFSQCFDRSSQQGDRSQFAIFGQAIRLIQKEEVITAIYILLTSGLVHVPLEIANAVRLEKLREEHVRWLEMDEEKNKAQFYKDVAAMTGLLYAFCSYVRGEVKKANGNERIEVRKIIERSDDPYQFDYTAAGNIRSETATLFRQADMYYSYDQLKDLLKKIGVDVVGRESDANSDKKLKLYFDDVVNAYTYFFDTDYKTTKQQRDFTYALKLSLYARFPELIESPKKEND